MASFNFQVHSDSIQPLATKSGDGTGATARGSSSSRILEIWIRVTAIDGGATLTPIVIGTLDGTNYADLKTIATPITATGVYTMILNRAESAFGKSMNVRWTLAGGNATFEILVGKVE